jgi:hypothetical protein
LSASATFTVIPRCSPLDLVRLWCGTWSARASSIAIERRRRSTR